MTIISKKIINNYLKHIQKMKTIICCLLILNFFRDHKDYLQIESMYTNQIDDYVCHCTL